MSDPEPFYPADSLEERVLRGDPDALAEVLRWVAMVLTSPRFWRLRGDWPDLQQECLRRLWVSLRDRRFDASHGLRAYVQGLVRYTALEALERLPRSVEAVDAPPLTRGPAAESDAVRRLLARSVMDRVPETCRVLFRLFFYEDRTHDEIAELLAIPVGTVKSRMFRCMQTAHRLFGSRRRAIADRGGRRMRMVLGQRSLEDREGAP